MNDDLHPNPLDDTPEDRVARLVEFDEALATGTTPECADTDDEVLREFACIDLLRRHWGLASPGHA